MDKGFIPYSLLITASIYGGIFNAFFEGAWSPTHTRVMVTFSFSALVVVLFMVIQKRIHKEVFLEIKQRVS